MDGMALFFVLVHTIHHYIYNWLLPFYRTSKYDLNLGENLRGKEGEYEKSN